MKKILLLLALGLMTGQLQAQLAEEACGSASNQRSVSYAPLHLFNDGGGSIFPFEDGERLRVGRQYPLIAIPVRGYEFAGWNQVNVFTLTSAEIDDNTDPISTNYVTSVVRSPLPISVKKPFLTFTMEPEQVLYDFNGNSLTQSVGWQANFVPIVRKVRMETPSATSHGH